MRQTSLKRHGRMGREERNGMLIAEKDGNLLRPACFLYVNVMRSGH